MAINSSIINNLQKNKSVIGINSKINLFDCLKKDTYNSTIKPLFSEEIIAARKAFIESIRSSRPEKIGNISFSFISTAEEKVFERFKSLAFIEGRKEQLSLLDMKELATLPDEVFERIKNFLFIAGRKDKQFTGTDIRALADITDECFPKIKDLLFMESRGDFQLSGKAISQLSTLPDVILEKIKPFFYIKERGSQQFSDDDIITLAKKCWNILSVKIKFTQSKPKDNLEKFIENFRKISFIEKLGNNQLNCSDCLKYMELATISEEKLKAIDFRTAKMIIADLEDLLKRNRLPEYEAKIKSVLSTLRKKIDSVTSPIRVSKEANYAFWKNFLVTADKSNAEVIKSLDKIIQSHGKQGIPLKYTRADFIRDLNSRLDKLNPDEQSKILEKLGITLTEDKKGYDGLLNFNMLNPQNPKEAKIQELCKRFLLENEVITGNPQIDKFLNSVIKGMPEFVNIIGKKQHATHNYTLDMHTLKVLQEMVSDPKFETLSDIDKMAAQLMALFHDIGKLEGVIDKGHEKQSAVILNDIFGKVHLPEFLKRRVVELVKNHNWLEQINRGIITHEQAALMFRNPEDLKIAEIFTKADLKGVGSGFYERYGKDLEWHLPKVEQTLGNFYQTGNMIFPTRFTASSKIPTVIYNGVEYRVIDLAHLPEDFDLRQVGLSEASKKKLRFLVHAPKKIENFLTFDSLSKPFNESVISTSMITPTQKSLFGHNNIALIMDAPNSGVINCSPYNQISGTKRDFDAFVDMVFKKPSSQNDFINKFVGNINCSHRFHQMRVFMDYLSKRYKLSETDYEQIYKQLIGKNYLGQIEDITLSSGQVIKKGHLISAYKQIEKFILQYAGSSHNEVVLYNPSVKGVLFMGDKISEIPQEILQYVQERHLPIILMGKDGTTDLPQLL